MKTVILAGGLGSRLSEETHKVPKPMIKIGDKPIISHIINHFKKHNFFEVIICSGYKKELIDNYFKNEKTIQVVDTGLETQTGARIKNIKKLIGKDENFFMTYGDGLSDINLQKLLRFHKKNNKIATLSAVRPIPRFGHLTIENEKVIQFKEKDALSEGWINGGFFVLNSKVFDYLSDDQDCIFEKEPLENLSKDGELMAYKHKEFWHPIDTLRDKNYLNEMFNKGKAPWL
ncbi:sugar phosphate nucleotidyltransferase [Candidatus Pelagibacter sp.]|nr:sugar phosphate nucleotidyltransferase [Candidatus Pelagibacter sp.]